MIIDFRYHVVTLVAVFIALGLGILIGANLGKTVNLQFEKQIDHLETTYEKIRDDQKILQATLQVKENELEIANQFQKAIIPTLISNRLVGKRVAIIRTNDTIDFKYAKNLVDMLRQAGAEVTSVTSLTKIMNLSDPQFKTELVDAFDLPMKDEKDLLPEINLRILQIIASGQGTFQLQYLQGKEIAQLWGDYNRGPVDELIFLGGGMTPESDHQKEIDLPLLDAARKLNGVMAIGVEPSVALQSYMRIYQLKCQVTVDNIETAPGEVSLVYLLMSGKKGHYGIKDTARGLIPAMKLNY